MWTIKCPPYEIWKIEGKEKYIVYSICQGMCGGGYVVGKYNSLDKAKRRVKRFIGNQYSYYKERGYVGTKEDFLEFSTRVTVIKDYNKDDDKEDKQESVVSCILKFIFGIMCWPYLLFKDHS